jgi:hypothetical protein
MLAPIAACALWVGCEANSQQIENRVVEAGCGLCQFQIEGNPSCYWAVRIDGVPLMARGDAIPSSAEHDAHGETGMCHATREARVSGTVYPTHFLASEFALLPPAPGTRSTPHEHTH